MLYFALLSLAHCCWMLQLLAALVLWHLNSTLDNSTRLAFRYEASWAHGNSVSKTNPQMRRCWAKRWYGTGWLPITCLTPATPLPMSSSASVSSSSSSPSCVDRKNVSTTYLTTNTITVSLSHCIDRDGHTHFMLICFALCLEGFRFAAAAAVAKRSATSLWFALGQL